MNIELWSCEYYNILYSQISHIACRSLLAEIYSPHLLVCSSKRRLIAKKKASIPIRHATDSAHCKHIVHIYWYAETTN